MVFKQKENVQVESKTADIDKEWLCLMVMAKEQGLSIKEVQAFLENRK
ncbi:anti-repressor SinI family protein [Aquibacillus koreensis]|uniref:Anti-repressor SinI family protein n=1 Tax=Aquibacillus koreensis TaxID=279446 RepID=A0A9X4AJK1_9BACI|nr:anti-repressor SinI family protein [Aquibacillus koreensis]MCT2536999.1 anti-repressor SinI family protein [Aquibacillus koreensis]MDC3422347.1 anti-repressor SinI family protein [Aquibacillus koreensis]